MFSDECKKNPCEHEGKCYIKNGTETCNCKGTGYEGENCEKDINECPLKKPGYFGVLGKCYFIDNMARNFDDSQAHCKQVFPNGGRLFEPRDETTNKEVIKNRYNVFRWIGITDRISQGNYRYESDNGQLTVSQWWQGQPNDDNHHCVYFCGSNGNWCDQDCSASEYSLCERTY